MDIVTSIPVRLERLESVSALIEPLRERIARLACDNFVQRGCLHGYDFADWLNAERALVVAAAAEFRYSADDLIIEVTLPEIELPNLSLYAGSTQLVLSSDPNEDGLQIMNVIDLPSTISLDGLDAERTHNKLRITAALAAYYAVQQATA
ncbi:MAG TPA: DUF2934 domain-containing protein [Terriglobia bacterium]|nr:DUF2934 domain-containing protein [Terriglobia bacterium]